MEEQTATEDNTTSASMELSSSTKTMCFHLQTLLMLGR